MAVGIGADRASSAATTPGPVPAAGGRWRALRLPRSPKIVVGLVILAVFVIIAIIGPLVAPYNPNVSFANASVPLPPSGAHWLGTTALQQDVLSQLLSGGRSTLLVALIAGVVATALSVIVGVTAGYLGGLADDALSMLANIFLVMPALPLLIILFGFLGRSSADNDLVVALVISITGWAWGARVLRAQTLSLRNRDYVDSARLIGESNWRIIGTEIVPNLVPVIAASFLFTVLYGVGTYTAIAFLGYVNPDHWSWGSMLFYAQEVNAETSGYWWWFVPPGLAVALLGTSLALLNFGIDEFVNPRLRAAGLSGHPSRRTRGRTRRAFGQTAVIRADGGRP